MVLNKQPLPFIYELPPALILPPTTTIGAGFARALDVEPPDPKPLGVNDLGRDGEIEGGGDRGSRRT